MIKQLIFRHLEFPLLRPARLQSPDEGKGHSKSPSISWPASAVGSKPSPGSWQGGQTSTLIQQILSKPEKETRNGMFLPPFFNHTLTCIHAVKHSPKLTLSHRTSGPNCFFLSVWSLVNSFLPEIIRDANHNISRHLMYVWLTGFQLLLVISKVSHHKSVFPRFLLEFIRHFLKAGDGHEGVVIVLRQMIRTRQFNF